jgi:hypothetical protein
MRKSQGFHKIHRMARKKSILKNRFFRVSILISILFVSVFYLLFFSQVFQIKSVTISGEQKISKQDIANIVENQIQNKFLFFNTKSIFLVKRNEISNIALSEFPLIESVQINRKLPSSLFVIVTERIEVAKWCIENKCFLIDNNGIIFDPIRNEISNGAREIFENYSELSTIKSFNANGKFALGQEVVEKETLSKVLQIISKLEQNLEVQTKLADIVSKERLNIKTLENWEIYFNLAGDINWQITELGLILEKEIDLEKRQELEYIDLRFNRVFYK